MNYNHLTAKELIQYLDLTSTDPLVRRLLFLLDNEDLKTGLIEVGMDPVNCQFEDDWEHYSPGAYIEHLRHDVDYYRQEAEEWETRHAESEARCKELKARGIAKLLHEMEQEVISAKEEAYHARRAKEKTLKENEDLKEKINVWSILERT